MRTSLNWRRSGLVLACLALLMAAGQPGRSQPIPIPSDSPKIETPDVPPLGDPKRDTRLKVPDIRNRSRPYAGSSDGCCLRWRALWMHWVRKSSA
jgi:hypothetical protein